MSTPRGKKPSNPKEQTTNEYEDSSEATPTGKALEGEIHVKIPEEVTDDLKSWNKHIDEALREADIFRKVANTAIVNQDIEEADNLLIEAHAYVALVKTQLSALEEKAGLLEIGRSEDMSNASENELIRLMMKQIISKNLSSTDMLEKQLNVLQKSVDEKQVNMLQKGVERFVKQSQKEIMQSQKELMRSLPSPHPIGHAPIKATRAPTLVQSSAKKVEREEKRRSLSVKLTNFFQRIATGLSKLFSRSNSKKRQEDYPRGYSQGVHSLYGETSRTSRKDVVSKATPEPSRPQAGKGGRRGK